MHPEDVRDRICGIALVMFLMAPYALRNLDLIERVWRMVFR
jgi:hypothetical protein